MSNKYEHDARSIAPKFERRGRLAARMLAGAVTLVLIVALFAVLTIYRPLRQSVDATSVGAAAAGKTVSQTQLDSYCPARMALSDSASYGDSEYQTSTGDLASSARYAAFGSVYSATVGGINGNDAGSITLEDANALDTANVKTASDDAYQDARLISAGLLEAKTGTGIAASVASWATHGDLRGLAASNCLPLELSQTFLLSATTTGTTQQLIVANPSAKSTSLTITIHGDTQTGRLPLSTGSTLAIDAYGQKIVDLSAAAPKQQGLYVTVSSEQTPVAAVVSTVAMDGLTPQGSDFASPVPSAAANAVMPAVEQSDRVTIIAYSDKDTEATFSWVKADARSEAGKRRLTAGKVELVDLGAAPEGTYAVSSSADEPVHVEAKVTRSSDGGNQDFAFIAGAGGFESSAIVLPDKTGAELVLANTADEQSEVTVHAYDAKGGFLTDKQISLNPNAATRVSSSDFGGGAELFTLDGSAAVVWGARLSQQDVVAAKREAVAYLPPSALEPRSEVIWAAPNQSIVH